MKAYIDTDAATVTIEDPGPPRTVGLGTPEGFRVVSDLWLRSGWDTKYVYGFTWMGRPIIQLPEDLVRIQEVIYDVRPDVIVETGVAHGGSLIFYASLCRAMARGRVVGVDVEIRPHNRAAIEAHELFDLVTLVEGGSTDPDIVDRVRHEVRGERAIVILDSNHTYDHVLAELRAYAPLVPVGSYLVATDGIMQSLVGAPRSRDDWTTNNPQRAARTFLEECRDFEGVEPHFPFNEGLVSERVTYWPNAFLRRVAP